MHFEIKHRFECEPARLWALIDSAEFDRRLAQESGTGREVIERREVAGESYVKRRITKKSELPAAMKKVVGTDRITYDQESWHKPGTETLRWKIAPQVLVDRFSGSGTTILRATPNGCERIIRGDLTIRVPLLGATMEKKLVEDVSASYDLAARIAVKMLSEGWTPETP
jgi:hypothetical protein